MSISKCLRFLYDKVGRVFFSINTIFLWLSIANAQDIFVLKSNGTSAFISEGSGGGIKRGDLFVVKRFEDGSWKEITYAEVTYVRYNMARVHVLDDAPQVPIKPGDVVEEFTIDSLMNERSISTENKKPPLLLDSSSFKKTKWAYLGPAVGLFIPVGDMRNVFKNDLGYGGIMGIRFRPDLDMTMRFFYAAKTNEWSFWNLQLLGRRYFAQGLLVDFGYGIFYPKIETGNVSFSGKGENIYLGFIGGFGFSYPIALAEQFEIGCLFHYYPNFGDKSGLFFMIQVRLIL